MFCFTSELACEKKQTKPLTLSHPCWELAQVLCAFCEEFAVHGPCEHAYAYLISCGALDMKQQSAPRAASSTKRSARGEALCYPPEAATGNVRPQRRICAPSTHTREASSTKAAEAVDAALLGILRSLNLVTPDLLTRILQEEATAHTFANGDLTSLTQLFNITSGRAERIQRAARETENTLDRPLEKLTEAEHPEAGAASTRRVASTGSQPSWVVSQNQKLHFVIDGTHTPMCRGQDGKPLDRIVGKGSGLQQAANMKVPTCDRCFAMLPEAMQTSFTLMSVPQL